MKISVIMPSFNQAKFLESSIQSVLSQNYSKLEFIIMDGGSTDGSVDIIKKYSNDIVYWQSKKDGGQSAAINEGMKRATGEVCCWLNSDDLYFPETLKKVAEYFKNNPECDWLVGGGVQRTVEGDVLLEFSPKDLTVEGLVNWDVNYINQPSVFWRKSLWQKVDGLNPSLNCVMDFELWLKFSRISHAHGLNDNLAISVVHDEMKTMCLGAEMLVEHSLVLQKYGYFGKAKEKLLRPVKRAFEIDHKFRFITRNKLYRKWRDKNS